MRSKYKILNKQGLYFVTSTIVEWIPVFTSEKYFNILTDAVEFSQANKELKVFAYVVMDNHFHMILQHENLTNVMKSIKSFTAKQIIEQLHADRKNWLLNQLHYYKLKYKIESDYQVWQESYHPKQILTDNIFQQKIEYIHLNPVKRGYVNKPEDWKYSSASYFITGEEGVIRLNGYDIPGQECYNIPKQELGN